jgi:MFS transporter, DHA3 family, macrolide efflux protein
MGKERKKPNTNLILLLLGRMVSDVGSSIQMLILPLYIIDIGGSAATIGLFSFLSLMPILIAYPFSGVLGDRLNRKMIMVIADFASALFVLVLAYMSYIDKMNIVALLLIQAFVALFYGFFDPATKGMIPQLVAKEDLNKTNSKVATLRILSGLVAPLIAVALYTAYGITLLFLINGISFLISALSEMMIKYVHTKKESIEGIKGIFHDMWEGIKFIKDSKVIKKLSVFFLVIFAFIQPIFAVILPLFFRTKLDYSDIQYGYLQVVLFLGALIGSVAVGFFGKEKNLRKPLIIGVGAVSIAMLCFSGLLFPSVVSLLGNNSIRYLISFAGVMFVLYTAIMFISIPVQTIIQKATPHDYMSRVFSIFSMITKGGMPLGALVYGFVLNKIDIHTTAVVAGAIVFIISFVFITSVKKIEEF